MNNAAFITGFSPVTNPAPRNTTTWSIDDTLNWLKGSHSLSMGGGYSGVFNRGNSYNPVTSIQLGFDNNTDPAATTMFAAANFPSATAAQLAEARGMYAILTGRVLSIPGTARLDSGTGQVRLQRRPRAQIPAVQLRRLPLGFVAGNAGVDRQCGCPMGCAHALHACGQHVVSGDD